VCLCMVVGDSEFRDVYVSFHSFSEGEVSGLQITLQDNTDRLLTAFSQHSANRSLLAATVERKATEERHSKRADLMIAFMQHGMSPTDAETKARDVLPSPPPPITPAGNKEISHPPPNLPLPTPTHDSNDEPAGALISNIQDSLVAGPQHTRTSDVEVVSPIKTTAVEATAPQAVHGTASHTVPNVQCATGSAHGSTAQQRETNTSWQSRCKEAFVRVQKYLSEKGIAPAANKHLFWKALEHIIGRLVQKNHIDKVEVVMDFFRSCDSEDKVRERMKPLLKHLEPWLL
jgi:hypothetical protein